MANGLFHGRLVFVPGCFTQSIRLSKPTNAQKVPTSEVVKPSHLFHAKVCRTCIKNLTQEICTSLLSVCHTCLTRPRRFVTFYISALEILLLTYLLSITAVTGNVAYWQQQTECIKIAVTTHVCYCP